MNELIGFNLQQLKRRLELAKNRDYTWTDVSERAGVPYNTLLRMVHNEPESMHRPSLTKLYHFFRSEGLNIDVGDLFTMVPVGDKALE